MRDDGAVLGRKIVEVVDGAQAAGARHVLHHRGRVAWDEAHDVARHQPRIDVEAAAGAVTDDHGDLLALVEIGNAVGCRRRDGCGGCDRRDENQRASAADFVHGWSSFSFVFFPVREAGAPATRNTVLLSWMTTSGSAA